MKLVLGIGIALSLMVGCASPAEEEDDATNGEDALTGYVPPAAYAEGKLHSDLTDEVVVHLAEIHARTSTRRDDHVFIKVGDSITYSTDFLRCFATTRLGNDHESLEPTRTFFTAASWTRQSKASTVGWHTPQPITGNPAPLDIETSEMRPAFAVVMLGTNDTYEGSQPTFKRNLQKVVDRISALGIVPILSTIPPRTQAAADLVVPKMNAVVRQVAAESLVPLMDFHLALSRVPGRGLSSDGVHPFAARTGACDFSSTGLVAGYNQRNLLTIQALDRVKRAVLD